jgi:hypothetical protein
MSKAIQLTFQKCEFNIPRGHREAAREIMETTVGAVVGSPKPLLNVAGLPGKQRRYSFADSNNTDSGECGVNVGILQANDNVGILIVQVEKISAAIQNTFSFMILNLILMFIQFVLISINRSYGILYIKMNTFRYITPL